MNKARLKDLRKKKGLTLDQLAEQSGVSKRIIQNYESKEYTHFPNAETLRAICRILCPEDPRKAWDEVMDFPDSVREDNHSSDSSDAGDVREDTVFGDKGDAVSTSEDIICEEGLNEDYSYEKTLLERWADKMPAGLNGALVVLLDPESTDSVMGAIAGMCGYLRISSGSPAVCGATFEFLSSFASVIQRSILTKNSEHLERFTRAIIADVRELVSGEGVPDSVAVEVKNAVDGLIRSRSSNCQEECLKASRTVFFSIFDAWNYINSIPLSYVILSHFAMLFGETDDTPDLRKQVFFAVINHFDEVEVAERATSCMRG